MMHPSKRRIMFWCTPACALMLALPLSSALGSVQDKVNESRIPLPPSGERGFSGEIEYAFDTALNMTTARFKTSLESRGIFSRIFRGSPPVHTLTAAYETVGREPLNAPDSIRISLVSDELSQAYSDNGLSRAPELALTLMLGDSVVRFPMSISQKTELWWPYDGLAREVHAPQGADARINFNAPTPPVHIHRTATVRVSICAFLALVVAKDVHGTAAGLGFELDEDVIAGLREFAAGMAPTTAAQASVSCHSK